tara:strand:+ start:55 stop:384 length:330 start_codon:yes stop_codon:yes gene_type:complete
MRKIESAMVAAIIANKTFSNGNTTVTRVNESLHVHLHGNHIATVTSAGLSVLDGGWRSVTTKSRLNALINGLCDGRNNGVYQRKGVWYVTKNGNDELFTNGVTFSRVSR